MQATGSYRCQGDCGGVPAHTPSLVPGVVSKLRPHGFSRTARSGSIFAPPSARPEWLEGNFVRHEPPWKTALVTGASGGIGGCIARECAQRGMRVVAVGRNPESLQALRAGTH